METNRRNRGGRARDVFFAAGITLAVMLLSWLMCPPTFTETNDDALMAALAYGTMARPTVFLAYMNVAVGYAIRALLAMFPGVGWYGVLQVGTVYVSSTVLSYLVLRRFRGWKALFPLSFLYLFFGFNLFCSLQFTRTAAVAVVAGFMLLFSAMRRGGHWPAKLFGCLLAAWGSLFRFTAFGMLCLVFAILGIVAVIRLLRERGVRAALAYCLPFAIVIAVAVGMNVASNAAYRRDPGWSEFLEINTYRDRLQEGKVNQDDANGFPHYDENQALYESLDITREDWELYSAQRNTADPTFLNLETIRALSDARSEKQISAQWVGSALSTMARTFADYATYPALLLALVIGISGVITGHHRGKRFAVLAWGFAVLLALQVYFFYRGKFALNRIDTSLFLAIVSMLLLWVWDEKAPIWDRRHVAIVLSIGILVVNVPAYTGYLDKKQDMREDAAAQAEIRSLIASDGDHFYYYYRNWGYFPDVIYDIWHAQEAGSGKNACLMGSWMVSTPAAREQWANYGVTNPYADMVNNEGIYLMCFNGDQVSRVLTHIQQHYNPKAKAYQVKSVGEDGKYKIYRITSKLPNAKAKGAVDGAEALTWSAQLKAKEEAGSCTLSGYAFRQGDNSFAANLYYGITGADGKETLNYLRQRPRDGADNLDGGYAAFKSTVTVPEDALAVSVYYESPDGTVFRLPVEGR